jgi:hypothetical protein
MSQQAVSAGIISKFNCSIISSKTEETNTKAAKMLTSYLTHKF